MALLRAQPSSLQAINYWCHTLLHHWRRGVTVRETNTPLFKVCIQEVSNSSLSPKWSAGTLKCIFKTFQADGEAISKDVCLFLSPSSPEVGNLTPKETLGSCIPFVHCGAALPFPCSRDAVRSSKQQAPHIFQGNRQFPEVCPSSFTEFIVQAMAQVTALASTAAFIDSVGLLPTKERGETRWILITFWLPIPRPGKYLFTWLETRCVAYTYSLQQLAPEHRQTTTSWLNTMQIPQLWHSGTLPPGPWCCHTCLSGTQNQCKRTVGRFPVLTIKKI